MDDWIKISLQLYIYITTLSLRHLVLTNLATEPGLKNSEVLCCISTWGDVFWV